MLLSDVTTDKTRDDLPKFVKPFNTDSGFFRVLMTQSKSLLLTLNGPGPCPSLGCINRSLLQSIKQCRAIERQRERMDECTVCDSSINVGFGVSHLIVERVAGFFSRMLNVQTRCIVDDFQADEQCDALLQFIRCEPECVCVYICLLYEKRRIELSQSFKLFVFQLLHVAFREVN